MPAEEPFIQRIRRCRGGVYASGKLRGCSGKVFDIHPTGLPEPAGDVRRRLVHEGHPRRTFETGLAIGTDPDPAAKRFGLVRSSSTPPERAWDHFVPFWD